MIELKKVNLTINSQPILKNIDLKIAKGECIVLIGASGSGKSSLINVLAGLIPELYAATLSGNIHVFQHSLPVANFYDYVKDIGIVFQNPKTQFFMSDVLSELAFPMENYGIPTQDMKNRLQEQSETLELAPFIDQQMLALSGGEKQLIAFASSSMLSHQLFLLDEPSSNLDLITQQKILTQLIQLKKQGHTLIIAEHRLEYLLPLADRFVLLDKGHVRAIYTKEELINFSNNTLHHLGLRGIHPTEKTSLNVYDSSSPTITIKNLSFAYSKKKPAQLSIPSLSIDKHTITGLTGHNGAGKTTFSKILTGLLQPTTGSIYFDSKKMSSKDLIRKSFLVMQDVNLQLFFETVEKELTAIPVKKDLFEQVVTHLNLEKLLMRHPQTLSGGEKQRVAIASALLSGKELIIFDEPTSGLDYTHMTHFSQTLQWLKQLGVVCIVISHDQEFLDTACDTLLTLSNGQLKKP